MECHQRPSIALWVHPFRGAEGGREGRWVKARFHEPMNHNDERNKTADEWRLTKNNRSV